MGMVLVCNLLIFIYASIDISLKNLNYEFT